MELQRVEPVADRSGFPRGSLGDSEEPYVVHAEACGCHADHAQHAAAAAVVAVVAVEPDA